MAGTLNERQQVFMDTIDTYTDDSSEKHAQCLVLVDLGTAAWLWLWLCLFREGLKMFKM